MRLNECETAVDLLPEVRLVTVQPAAHVDVLGALPRNKNTTERACVPVSATAIRSGSGDARMAAASCAVPATNAALHSKAFRLLAAYTPYPTD